MKKIFFALGILAILLLGGCAKQYVCSDGKTVSDPTACTPTKTTEQPITNIPSEPKTAVTTTPAEQPKQTIEIDSDVQKLFDKAKTLTNYEYIYTAPKNGFIGKVSVLGNNMRILFSKGPQTYEGYKYDTVYFDLTRKTAYAMCTTLGDCENMTAAKQEDYNRVYVETVIDQINQVTYAKTTGEEIVDNRNCKVINYKLSNGESGRMWIDEYYGVPLKKTFNMDNEQVSATYYGFSKDSAKDTVVKMSPDAEII